MSTTYNIIDHATKHVILQNWKNWYNGGDACDDSQKHPKAIIKKETHKVIAKPFLKT